MIRHKRSKREHRLLGFKAYADTDQDILDWWEGIPEGERSEMIRDVIREYLGGRPRLKYRQTTFPELIQVQDDTQWIRTALNDMPGYLERVIQQVAVLQPAAMSPRGQPEIEQSEAVGLNRNAGERRSLRIQNRGW